MTYQHTPSPTSAEIVASLEYRGFLDFPARREHINLAKVQTQLNAVTEELGELARMLRRHDQGRADIDLPELALEAADLASPPSACSVTRPAWTPTTYSPPSSGPTKRAAGCTPG